jgi:hypothetical protein
MTKEAYCRYTLPKQIGRLANILRQMEEQHVVLVTFTFPHILLVIV